MVLEGACILARVPIYGTEDAGRKFWKRLRSEFLSAGFQENRVLKALYSYADETGDVKVMVGTHVDDIIWACKPEAEHMIAEIIQKFQCGEPEVGNFRYCGKEVAQDDDYSITITCKDTICLPIIDCYPIRI